MIADRLEDAANLALEQSPWLIGALAVALLLALAPSSGSMGAARWKRRLGVAILIGFAALNTAIVGLNVHTPRDWDFKCFWSWGVAVQEGVSPYDQENLLRIVEPLGLDPESVPEFHCLYPPPSLLLFAPLGLLPFKAALVAWCAVQAVVLAWCLWLTRRLYFDANQCYMALGIVAWGGASWATSATFAYAQTNFLVLLALLLIWRDRANPRAGVWLALGVFVKPLVAGMALYLIARRRWGSLAAAAATGGILTGTAWWVLGGELFESFLQRDDVSQGYPLAQPLNQSLSGVLLRWSGANGAEASLTSQPVVFAAVVGLVAVTVAVVASLGRRRDGAAFAALLAMTLLAYPASLAHYGVALLAPLAWVLGETDRHKSGQRGAILLATTCAFAIALKATFFASLAVWLVMITACVWPGRDSSVDHA